MAAWSQFAGFTSHNFILRRLTLSWILDGGYFCRMRTLRSADQIIGRFSLVWVA